MLNWLNSNIKICGTDKKWVGSKMRGRSGRRLQAQNGFREETGWQCFLSEKQQIPQTWVRKMKWLSVIDQALYFQLKYSLQSLQSEVYLPNTEEGSIREVKQLAQHTASKPSLCTAHHWALWGPIWERMLILKQPQVVGLTLLFS